MKFGEELISKIFEPWRVSYIDYNRLKIDFKNRQLNHQWTALDETEFRTSLKCELDKVYGFVSLRIHDLKRRIELCEKSLDNLNQNSDTTHYDRIDDELTEILLDINDISRFTQLNWTGFRKILKKHDRWTNINLTNSFATSLQEKPLDNQRFDSLFVKISRLHDMCRLRGRVRSGNSAAGEDQTAFERATAKYWIHPDNISEVKAIILLHLPVLIFDQNKPYEEADSAVSSVYFDNNEFDLYSERLQRLDGAEAIRFRWYGHEQAKCIYIERKTHHAPWMNGHSVKDRFRLKEHQVNDFMQGKYTADMLASDLRLKGKLDEVAIEDHRFIASGIQQSIRERRLRPMCRVFYNRTAFQLPGDQRLRLSLDCNMTFIREDHLDFRKRRHNDNWRRTDVGIDYPFRNISQQDVIRFPYAVLETKLQTHLGQETPEWLNRLLSSHLVHEVPNFSKYLHGAAMIHSHLTPVLPWWLSEMEIDIRKQPTISCGLSRSRSLKPLVNGKRRASLEKDYLTAVAASAAAAATTASTTANGTHTCPSVKINLASFDSDDKLSGETFGAYSEKDKDVKAKAVFVMNKVAHKIASQKKHFQYSWRPRKKAQDVENRPIRPVIPMKKIEPKAFFANERTFISWLQFCALLLTVALNLLNYGDHISRTVGAIFLMISALLAIYAQIRFQYRAWQLRNQNSARYDDIWGPLALCILLVVALIINFYLRFAQGSAPSHPINQS
ncbi:VTC domain-containing protein [Umbelopsis sp. PMI_123]|nr:VTC domain-containing protein [Umbelopsis sp. PMI_123]